MSASGSAPRGAAPPAATQPTKPNYNLNFPSVIGGREERGVRGPGFGKRSRSPLRRLLSASSLHYAFAFLFDAGPKPKVKASDFEDLVSNQGFAFKPDKRGPKTIAEMRRQELTKDMDPLKLQVCKVNAMKNNCWTNST